MVMIDVVKPAPFMESMALLAGEISLKPHLRLAASLQCADAKTFGFLADGRLVAVMGFWPIGERSEEIFLVGRPASEIGPLMVQLARRARLIIAARLYLGTEAMVGFVRSDNHAGQRLARIAGFTRMAGDPSDVFQRWEIRRDGFDRTGNQWALWRRQQQGHEGCPAGGTAGTGADASLPGPTAPGGQ